MSRTAFVDDLLMVMPLDEEAVRDGIRLNDRVVAIDGKPTAPTMRGWTEQLRGADGTPVELGLLHTDGSTSRVTIVRDSHRIERAYAGSGITYETNRWARFVVEGAQTLFLLLVSLVLVLRRAREPVAALLAFNWSFGSIELSALGASAFLELLQYAAVFIGLPLGIALFPDSRFQSRWNWVVVAIIPMMIFAYLLRSTMGSAAVVFPFFMFLLFVSLAASVVTRYRALPPGEQKQQIKYFTFGAVVLAACMVTGAILSAFGLAGIPDGGTYGWLSVAFSTILAIGFIAFGSGILISLLRYRLYDAERTISRSVAIGALTLSLVAIFAGAEKMAEVFGEEWFGRDIGAVAGGLGAAVAAVFIAPLHKRLDGWAERWFQSDLTHLRHDMPDLIGDWRETMTPAELAEAVLQRVVPTVRAGCGAVALGGDAVALYEVDRAATRAWLADHGGEPARLLEQDIGAAPFSTRLSLTAAGHGRIGWLLLGPRPDGSALGKDEREALLAIADPLARGLRVASERELRRAETERRIARLERALADRDRQGRAGRAAEPSLVARILGAFTGRPA